MRFIIFLAIAIISQQSFAQQQCGTTIKDQYEVRATMFRNRANFSDQAELIHRQRFTIYIPVAIHLISDSVGTDMPAINQVLGMMCQLNEDFADQNLQFYIKDSIHYLADNEIYANAHDSVAIDKMILQKKNDAANIFVGNYTHPNFRGYYSQRGDFIFISNSYANHGSTAITHEFGHFFKLVHTFFGWEETNAFGLYNSTPSPTSISHDEYGLVEVEYVARAGGNANCYSSADGFCDTEADYLSFAVNCPNVYTVLDPSGTAITPDSSLFMSHFSDNCVHKFSPKQKIAMMADVVARGWTNFPAPNTNVVTAASATPINPTDLALVNIDSILGDSIRLEWDTPHTTTATKWVVTIDEYHNGMQLGTIYQQIIGSQYYVNIPLSILKHNRHYQWRVFPFNNGYVCGSASNIFSFNTNIVDHVQNLIKLTPDLQILQNPVQHQLLSISTKSFETLDAYVYIYASDGRKIHQRQIHLQPGQETWQITLNQLPAGVYQLVLQSSKGTVSKRFNIIN